ncbi:MAG: hypothetical protein LBC89_02310 [Bacteroidales bacterium]|jgi:hypothetical protein|nr:hypothetical protein [Bacteroidales bacterium]
MKIIKVILKAFVAVLILALFVACASGSKANRNCPAYSRQYRNYETLPY